MSSPESLSIESVTVAFPRQPEPVLTNVSLTVEPGSTTVLLGPNGAGKTTLFRVVGGTLSPQAGSVRIGTCNLLRDRRGLAKVAFVPEGDRSLYMRYTGRENILLYLARQGQRLDAAEFADLSEKLELTHVMDKEVRTFSKGMRQKLCLIGPMLLPAPFILFDEPTVGLDVDASDIIVQFTHFMRKRGRSFLITTHELNFAQRCATDIAILQGGKMIASGPATSFTALNGVRQYALTVRCSESFELEGWVGQLLSADTMYFSREDAVEDDLRRALAHIADCGFIPISVTSDEPDLSSAYRRLIHRDKFADSHDPLSLERLSSFSMGSSR